MVMSKENKSLVLESLYRCVGCNEIKSLDTSFDIKGALNRIHRYNSRCKDCERIRRADIASRQRNNPKWYCKKLCIQLKHRAKSLDIAFNLNPEILFNLWIQQRGLCYYTQQSMDFLAHNESRKSPHIDYPSIDRMYPSKGYTIDNICWCKWGVNRMKNDLDKDQFLLFCSSVKQLS